GIVNRLAQVGKSQATSDVNGHRPVDLAAFYGRTEAWTALALAQTESSNEITPTSVKALIGKSISHGEMMAWYLGHSGWAIRTQNHLFILDYAPGEPEREDASLVNGRIDLSEWGDLTVIVVATHHHGDHFDRRILEWDHPRLRRVYGWDAPQDLAGFRFTGQEFKRIGDVVIASIPATDAGSAFLIEADGVSFFHAGDHAAGHAPIEPEFSESIEWLADQFAPIQAAFLPVFGCGLPSPDTLRAGNGFTIEKLNPDAVFPMHIGWTSHLYRDFERWVRESNQDVGLGIADQPGDRFLIRNGTIEQIWV
ncbi:MBL fold metallo-hydrolase, partial [Candidatus Bipolaricaulota bacterium]|nr:MBL fold metallo-hydrolase [Candidatus Bipolaricaulota bacterium]